MIGWLKSLIHPSRWVHCRRCAARMEWRRHSLTTAFDRMTGKRVESYWDVWACPSWEYVHGNPHDTSWVRYRTDVDPVSIAVLA